MINLRSRESPNTHGTQASSFINRKIDERIIKNLIRLTESDEDYWTFRKSAARRQAHGITQYPAMMVPPMQAILLNVVAENDTKTQRVFDPFAGSGTTLVECMRLGLNYTGQDINPLAILLCRTKAGPFHTRRLAQAVHNVTEWAVSDQCMDIEADFPGLNKWFSSSTILELSRIRRAIRRIDNLWCRQALWSSMAETVRRVSNSRTSTFKLHIRSREDLLSRSIQPLRLFSQIANDVSNRLHAEANQLKQTGIVSANGWYRGSVVLRLGDSAKSAPTVKGGHDLLITSPPYGDNTTTVPYGQYSYLPLQWIDLQDIDENACSSYLSSTCEIDSRSLGGSRRDAVLDVQHLLSFSPSLRRTLSRLENLPADRAGRVAAFCRDLNAALDPMIDSLRSNAYMIWTVGNRCVGGGAVPTDFILKELMAIRGVQLVTRIERSIPSKRMATRNSIAGTIRAETILVFRKA